MDGTVHEQVRTAAGVTVVTHFQPFYNLQTDSLQGVEALARVRSQDPSQADYFSAARAAGDLRALDLAVLEDALSFIAEWNRTRDKLILAVNLSWELVGDWAFVNDIRTALDRHGVPADRLLVDLSAQTFRRAMLDEGVLERLQKLQVRDRVLH